MGACCLRTLLVTVIAAMFMALLCSVARASEQSEPAGGPQCPVDMVPADTFCIDRYEYPNRAGVKPRNDLTFAEAVEVCLSEGKRLCTTDEWSRACSGPRRLKYPYGNELRYGACNLGTAHITQHWTWYGLRKTERDVVLSEPAVAGRYESCVSGYGAYDMLGNYWEWTNAGVAEHAVLMGGCWATASDTVSCLSKTEKAIKFYRVQSVSFRCCRDFLPKPESGDVQKPPE